MISLIFHTPECWRWNKFPEKPAHITNDASTHIKMQAYEKQVAELMASALEVANPEILKTFGYLDLPTSQINGTMCIRWPGDISFKEVDVHSIQTGRSPIMMKTVVVLHLPKEQEVREEDDDIEAMDKKFSESAKKILDTATKNLIVVNKNLKSENEALRKELSFEKSVNKTMLETADKLNSNLQSVNDLNEALRQSVRELNNSLEKIYNLIFKKDDEGHVVCFPDDMDFGSVRNELESAIYRAKQHVGKPG